MVGFAMTRIFAAAFLAALIWRGPALAAEPPALYEAQAIVTGQEAAERARGLGLCLADVLIKLSGDPGLAGDPRLADWQQRAAELVASYRYHDRMEGIPIHDEQGTRERPYDLLVRFDAAKTDAALDVLGREPWTGPRPAVALFIGMKLADQAIVLTADGDRDFAPRLALADASQRRGVPILLPRAAELGGLAYDRLAPGPDLDRRAAAIGGDLALVGHLVWSDATLSWQADWDFVWQGTAHRWQRPAENFDAGFRQGIEGVAQILSGHGEPH
jgi:hypothetical protein